MFIADAMLGSFARKLRIFGYDTLYFRGGDDSALLREARRGKRILLTSDRSLAQRALKKGFIAFFVVGSRDGQLFASLGENAAESNVSLMPGPPRCAICNGSLRTVTRSEARSGLPPGVAERHRLFYSCQRCGKLYWRGGHWRRLSSLGRVIAKNPFNQSPRTVFHAAHARAGTKNRHNRPRAS